MAESDGKKRPPSFIDEEQIEIKPSTELIPDEYERQENGNMLVELICRPTDEESVELADKLTKLGYSVNKTLIDKKKDSDDSWVSTFVADVNDKNKQNNYDGLLMIFAKVQFSNEMLKSIWGQFTSLKCPALKNKPKIFIFQIFQRGPMTDSFISKAVPPSYDTPAEADILIIYDKFLAGVSSNDFLENLHEHMTTYGNQEDIISLVSISLGSESRPLIISTMTRKFFFTLNQYRGNHHNINESHVEIRENLKKIMKFVKTIPDQKPKDKDKSKIMNSVLRTFNSFRNKSHIGRESEANGNKTPESDKAPTVTEVKEEKLLLAPQKSNKVKEAIPVESPKKNPKPLKVSKDSIASPPSKSPRRKSSSSSIPSITPTRKGSIRTKTISGTFSSKEDIAKKGPWKP